MKIKRFFAADIRQAMRSVKAELGPDAVILSNKSVDGGVEIVAARDFDEQALKKALPTEQSATAMPAPPASASDKPSKPVKKLLEFPDYAPDKERLHVISSPRKADNLNREAKIPKRHADTYLGYAEKALLNQPSQANVATASNPKPLSKRPLPISTTDSKASEATLLMPKVDGKLNTALTKPSVPKAVTRSALEEELLGEIRKEFKQLTVSMAAKLSEASFVNTLQSNPVRLNLLQRLADMGMSKKLSLKLANRLGAHTDVDFAFHKAQEMMTKVLPVANHNVLDQGGIVALVGPTGVGKTTTIAKLAAKFIVRHGARQVALVTMDNYRIAAHEQLSIYGRILDVPVRRAASSEELRAVLTEFLDRKLVLIDTAGMGPKDIRLAEQLNTLQEHDIAVTAYLVMAATTQYQALQAIVQAFQVVEPSACIITKLDEAESKGGILSILMEQQLPLAFIANGQQVPEDLHFPNATELVAQCVAAAEAAEDYQAEAGYEAWVTKGYG